MKTVGEETSVLAVAVAVVVVVVVVVVVEEEKEALLEIAVEVAVEGIDHPAVVAVDLLTTT